MGVQVLLIDAVIKKILLLRIRASHFPDHHVSCTIFLRVQAFGLLGLLSMTDAATGSSCRSHGTCSTHDFYY